MKKIIILFCLFVLTGCSTVKIPEYIQDDTPYSKSYFSSYSVTLDAVKDVLSGLGWEIVELRDPSVYERDNTVDSLFSDKVLIITQVKEKGFFVGTRYSRLNIYVYAVEENKTDVELRYLTVTALPFSSIRSYEHEFSSQRILSKIEEYLDN